MVQRLTAIFKRKAAPLTTESERGDSTNCLRDGSPTNVGSPTASTVSTSELNDLGMESRSDSSVSKTIGQRNEKRLSLDAKACALTLFDELEACVLCSLEQYHLKDFRSSAFHKRLIAFLFLQKRRVSEDDFTVLRVLGRGGFGMVNGCIKRTSASLYAMKVMNKKMIKKKHAEKLCLAERKILAMISSPFVVCLKYAFQTPEELFLVLDLRTGGDLSFHLNRARFSETQVRFWAAQILLGIQHLHDKNIVYRDLKPENILLDEKGNCSISDLGLAVEVTPTLTGRCGTRGYWAPEMLLRTRAEIGWYTTKQSIGGAMGAWCMSSCTGSVRFGHQRRKLCMRTSSKRMIRPRWSSRQRTTPSISLQKQQSSSSVSLPRCIIPQLLDKWLTLLRVDIPTYVQNC